MTTLNYLLPLAFHSTCAYIAAPGLELTRTRAVGTAAIHFFLNKEITINRNKRLPLNHLFDKLSTLSTSNRWKEGIKALRVYNPVMSRVLLPALFLKVLGCSNSKILGVCLFNEINLFALSINERIPLSRHTNGTATPLISAGAAYLATYKFSKVSTSIATETMIISMIYLCFSQRLEETCKSVHNDPKVDRFGKKIFKVLDQFAIPLTTLTYCAILYSKDVPPVNILALLGTAYFGKQVSDSVISIARGTEVSNINDQLRLI